MVRCAGMRLRIKCASEERASQDEAAILSTEAPFSYFLFLFLSKIRYIFQRLTPIKVRDCGSKVRDCGSKVRDCGSGELIGKTLTFSLTSK